MIEGTVIRLDVDRLLSGAILYGRSWADLHSVRRGRAADRLDAIDLAVFVDEPDDQRCRGSSSRAKKS
ncbi:hypothetical protein ACIG56_27210 [Nocardia fusca]|uniref:hypothetical protein n=1 Tax=Nocardia fusca TaxID=941183 RepID=UPI0037CBE489